MIRKAVIVVIIKIETICFHCVHKSSGKNQKLKKKYNIPTNNTLFICEIYRILLIFDNLMSWFLCLHSIFQFSIAAIFLTLFMSSNAYRHTVVEVAKVASPVGSHGPALINLHWPNALPGSYWGKGQGSSGASWGSGMLELLFLNSWH